MLWYILFGNIRFKNIFFKTNDEIGSKHLNRKVSPYYSDFMTIADDILNIEETKYDEDVLTFIHYTFF